MENPSGTKDERIGIISMDDVKIKILGELLSNESSRAILKLLSESEMTANQISQKTGMLLSLIIYHLKKMQDTEIVKISKIVKSGKELDMKYYALTKSAIMIFSSASYEKIKKNKSLSDLLKRISSFIAIAVAAVSSWWILKPSEIIYNNKMPPPLTPIETHTISVDLFWSVVIPLIIIIIGLVLERVIESIRALKSKSIFNKK